MPQASVPIDGLTRRIVAVASTALLAFTLVVAQPVVAPGSADTAQAAVDACGVNVLFVLDESGSMENEGEDAVRDGFTAFVTELGDEAPDSKIGVVEFNTTSRMPFGTNWKGVTGSDATDLLNYVNNTAGAGTGDPAGYEAGAWTNWEGALGDAVSFTNANSGDKPDYVVVITDGNPTTFVAPEDAGNPGPVPGSNPEDTNEMYVYGTYEALSEYNALSGLIPGSDTIIGFGAGENFDDPGTEARLGEIVDTVTTVSPLSLLAAEIADLAAKVCEPSLDVEKSTNGADADTPTGPVVAAGETVTWTYEVTNNGPVTVYDITVTDDDNDNATISCPNGNGTFDLDPGESEACTASSISWYTRNHKQHSNTATATGSDADSNVASDTDPSHYQPTLLCPYTATGDQIVIDIFNGDPNGDGGFLLGQGDSFVVDGLNVPAGDYNLSWASYDAHDIKNESNPGQTQEQWYLDFGGGASTGDTLDLPYDQDYITGDFPGVLTLGAAATEVTVAHGAASGGANSIHAICAILDPIDPADIGVTKTLITQSDLYNGDLATFEVTVSNGSDDESLTVTNLTENIGGSDLNLLVDNPGAPVVSNTCDNAFPATAIPPGGSETCQFAITVDLDMTSADDQRCDADGKIDVVTGTGIGELTGNESTDDDCEEITINPDPIIDVVKVDTGPGTYYDGAEVTFDVSITNTSDTESVTIDTLTDDIGDDVIDLLANPIDSALATNTCNANPQIVITPGATVDCAFSITVSVDMASADHQSCPSPDDIVDVVSASGTGNESGLDVADDDCETITVNAEPEIEVTKTLTTPGELNDGSSATFEVTIENLSSSESVTIDTLTEDYGQGLVDLTVVGGFDSNTCAGLPWPLTIDAGNSETCAFTIQIDVDEYVGTVHDDCDNTGLVNVVAASGVGNAGQIPVSDDDCEEVTIEAGGELAIDKTVLDPSSGLYVDLANLPSSTTFPATVQWQITVENITEFTIENVYLTDANAPACETEFAAALNAVEPGKDFLNAFESVTFTCESDIPSVPAVNIAIAGGQDVLGQDLPEVSDDAAVVQVLASATIGDTVWYDDNDNGVQDGSEKGISGTPVKLTGLDGQDVDPVTAGVQTTMTTTTDVDGKYLFSGLPDGNYRVEVALSTVPNPGTLALRFTTASSFTTLLPDGGSFLDADFGVVADELPVTGIDTESIILLAIILLVAGSVAVLIARRKNEFGVEAEAA